MKRFFRTIAGKITLFFSCAVMLTIAAVATVSVCVMLALGVYTNSQEDIFNSLASQRFVDITGDYFSMMGLFEGRRPIVNTGDDMINVILKIVDNENITVYETESAKNVVKWDACTVCFYYGNSLKCNIISNPPENFIPNVAHDDLIGVTFLKLKDGLPEKDYFSSLKNGINIAYTLRHWSYIIAVLSFLAFAVLFVMLMCVAGHRPDREDTAAGALNFLPYDILTLIFAGIIFAAVMITLEYGNQFGGAVVIPVLCCIVEAAIWAFLGLCMEAAARIKRKRLFKSTFLYRIFKLFLKGIKLLLKGLGKMFEGIGAVLSAVPMVWRTFAVWLGVLALDLIMVILFFDGLETFATVAFIVIKAVELVTLLYITSGLRRLEKAGREIASGNLEHKANLSGMSGDIKRYGETLNSISDTMADAVDEKLRSERMKTELITNVSHDIKTPLTSIINYTGLISKEQCDNPRIAEYSEVLNRQSERLKRLIEDLVEASKAATGNLEVDLVPCDASAFIEQAGGEYEDKLSGSNLQLVVKQPQEEMYIMADGRRMWRIFDNLMNNICKYALEGTRVFMSLEHIGNNAVFAFKNTSRAPLDLSEDELMERFTRGDSSRNTEGTGLGLSIAKSMAELQGGSLHLDIDGDFFKAVLSFPTVEVKTGE